MTPHPCRCETCTDDKCGYSPVENPNDVRSKDIDLLRGSSFWFVTRIKGCLSHPLAREYLNKEVIEELERRVGRLGTYNGKAQATRTYEAAIKLLKEGVPK